MRVQNLRLFAIFFGAVSLSACVGEPSPPVAPLTVARPHENVRPPAPTVLAEPEWDPVSFRTAINESFDTMFQGFPTWATGCGDHRFDDRWSDQTETGQAALA